jgi:hypothetical protein
MLILEGDLVFATIQIERTLSKNHSKIGVIKRGGK